MSRYLRIPRLLYHTTSNLNRSLLSRPLAVPSPFHTPTTPLYLTRPISTTNSLRNRDYYDLLGVSRSASDDEIKRAYFKLAKEYHPDVNKDPGAKGKFVEIGKAYEVLSNQEKRKQYDLMGHQGEQYAQQGFHYGDFHGAEEQFRSFTQEFEDIINQFMGGGHRVERSQSRQAEYTVPLTFMESAQGCTKHITHAFMVKCENCGGSGADNDYGFTTCRFCNGNGVLRRSLGPIQIQETCDKCNGAGKMPKRMCLDCRGTGEVKEERELSIRVPAGVLDKQSTMVRDPTSGQSILLHFRVNESLDFRRNGDDIHSTITVHMVQAAFGGNIRVMGLNGLMDVAIPAGVQSHHKIRLTGRGIPRINGTGKGDHYLHVKISIPKSLTEDQHQQLLKFAKLIDPEDMHGDFKAHDYSSIFAKLKRKVKGE